ncbi:MAG TPA: PadR family transcriptional regulator [Anaerolineales bacterium]|nr:PadR family transcriptional regulator [Anaerolineales bacterium]
MTTPVPDETILGILAAAPQHGYQIIQHFTDQNALGRIWTMSTSQVYAVLKRLETQAAITGSQTPSPEGPPKKEYALTKIGRSQLDNWLYASSPSTSIRRIRVEFLSKLYITSLLSLPTDEIIAAQILSCQNQQEILTKKRRETDSEIEALALDFILGQLDAALKWLDQLKAT